MHTQIMRASGLAGAKLRPNQTTPPRFWLVTLHRADTQATHHGSEAEAVRAAIKAMKLDASISRFSLEGKP